MVLLTLLSLLALITATEASAAEVPTCYLAEILPRRANLRKLPSLKNPDLVKAERGAIFAVQSVPGEEDWARITEGEQGGRVLHLSTARLSFRTDRQACKEVEGPAEVIANGVNARKGPSLDSPVAGKLFIGDPLTVTPGPAPWLKILFPEELNGGYIRSDLVKLRLPAE